jgi:hypothetical protein
VMPPATRERAAAKNPASNGASTRQPEAIGFR